MNYDNPFPGMNPYLEHRDIWPGFHDRLIAALDRELGPKLPGNYRIDLQRRVEVEEPFGGPSGLTFVIPDALVTNEPGPGVPAPGASATAVMEATVAAAAVAENATPVRVRMPREVRVTWLRVERGPNRKVVTIIEVLSPTNKAAGEGRRRYIRKREAVIASGVNLVEIDLLRRGEPMPLETAPPASDYRILVCRALERPEALLYPFGVKQAIPRFELPLLPEDAGPEVDLGAIIDGMHHTARYGPVAGYENPPPEPEFAPEVQDWVAERVAAYQQAAR